MAMPQPKMLRQNDSTFTVPEPEQKEASYHFEKEVTFQRNYLNSRKRE